MTTSRQPKILIISPALAKANNGNWQTARRWASFLRGRYRVDCMTQWDGTAVPARDDGPRMMIALHARRSAPSIAAFAEQFPQRPLALILTGTDLYRDIRTDAAARRSLQLASRLVLLQSAGLAELDPALHHKAQVIHQSAPALTPWTHAAHPRHVDVIMVGHLREEKQPETFMQAAGLVRSPRARLLHLGAALDPALGRLAEQVQAQVPCYRWLGPVPHSQARQRIKRSALMVIASRMEGGANVIIEAVTCGVPVLASDISGNRGMLGDDYAGYFPLGDSEALAGLIDRAVGDSAFHAHLRRQCALRAALFTPEREQAAVRQLVDNSVHDGLSPTRSVPIPALANPPTGLP